MEKKTFTTVTEIAREIGLNAPAQRLLKYLDQYHPDLALDLEYILEKADHAAQAKEDMLRNGYSYQEADHRSSEILMSGLEFSAFEIISGIVDEYFFGKGKARKSEEVKKIVMQIRPQLKSIFDQYPTDDPEFTAEIAYDEMCEKLKEDAEKLLAKVEQEEWDALPF